MTREQAVALCRYAKACCPQQAFDQYTPDAWHDLLGDLDLNDCRAAVAAVAQRQPFVSPSEIRAEVKRIRADRLGPAGPGLSPVPPPADPDDTAAYLKALREQQARIADGREQAPAIETSESGDYDDNPHVERIRAQFDAEREAARKRKAAAQEAEREALAAYREAVEELLALPDLGAAALAQAREELLGDAQAALGFPLRARALGLTDDHKVTIRAAHIAAKEIPA